MEPTSKPALPRLSDANYASWKTASVDFIIAKGLSRALEPAPKGALSMLYTLRRLPVPSNVPFTVLAAPTTSTTIEYIVVTSVEWDVAAKWANAMSNVVSSLRLAMTSTVRDRVQSAVTVDELWSILDGRYGTRTQAQQTRSMRELCRSDMEEGEDPVAFFDKMDDLRDRLAVAGMVVPDSYYASILVMSMPESLDATIQTLDATAEGKLTPDHVRNTIVSAFKSRQDRQASAARAKALVAAATPAPTSVRKCDHCGKDNHLVSSCFIKFPHLLEQRRKERAAAKAKSATTSTSTDLVTYSGPTASSSSSYRALASDDSLLVARASRSSSRRAPTKPHLDSGANRTFFHSRGVFLTYEAFDPPRKIEVANGVFSPAVGIGLVTLVSDRTGDRLELPGTWHAPEFVVDLVSTDTLTELGYECNFGAQSHCSISRAGRLVLEGKHSILDASPVLAADIGSPSVVGSARAAITVETLHHRLGHPSYSAVEKLITSKAVDGLDVKGPAALDVGDDVKCVSCVIGKSHKSSHPPSERVVTKPGELVVFDLVGPISPPTINGERYHLDAVDVASKAKFTWLLKRKDECEARVEAFVAEWERAHNRHFKAITLRYDLGSEVGSQRFRDKLAHQGIRFERAARQTPQQIGHAERSHRAVGESAATLLANAMLAEYKLPRTLWGFAVVTATYLSNFVPRTGTDGRTPLEIFTGKRPDISHLRVPFCEAYPLKLKSDRVFKYEPKAFDGVFIGYGHVDGLKAYYVYLRSTRKIILTCDVIFREAPLIEASRRSTFDAPNARDRPVELSPAVERRPVDLQPVPDRQSVAMPPAETVDAPPERVEPEEVVPEPAVVDPVVENTPQIADDGFGPEWGQLPVDAADVAPDSPPLEAAPLPDGANLLEESPPRADDFEEYDVAVRDEPSSPSPAPRPPTPFRPPDRAQSSSPDPLLINPGPDEVFINGSWYRIPSRPRPAPSSSLPRPRWRNVGSAKLAEAVTTTTTSSSTSRGVSGSLSLPPVPRDGGLVPVVDTLRALVARPGGHERVLRDEDLVVSDAVKDGRPGDYLLSAEAIPDDVDALYAADTEPAVAAAAHAAQAVGPHGPAPGARWKSVLGSSHPELWIASANKELDAQVENGSWEAFAEPPPDAFIVDSLWVHTWKYGASGELKAKSRIVAQGQTQVDGVNFDSSAIYVPSVGLEGLRFLMAITVHLGLYLHLVDFCTAYLNGLLNVIIYMRTPDGFAERFGKYVKLLRTLYGLRQAGRAWYELLHNLLVELGFECVNPTFGIYRCTRGADVMFICVYVDDLPMASSSLEWMDEIKRKLAARFKMTDLGPLTRILGIQVEYDRGKGVLRMHMGDYIDTVLERHNMASANGVGSPIVPGHTLGQPSDLATADASRSSAFLKEVGELLWLSRTVHFELSFVASLLARYAGKPTAECKRIMHHVHRYLRRTARAALVYRRDGTASGLVGYVDADWGGCPATARSTGAYFFLYNGMLVSWSSKRQPDVAGSSLVAETIASFFAIYSGLNEVRWMRTALAPLGIVFDEPTELRCDNLGAVQWASGTKHHSKVRHIHYRYHSVREWVQRKLIVIRHIGTADQLADIGTKALGVHHFHDLACRLGLDFG